MAEALEAAVPATTSVVLNVNAKKASVAVGTEEHLLLGARTTSRNPSGGLPSRSRRTRSSRRTQFRPSGSSAWWRRRASWRGNETVLDLYSGTGAISFLLARRSRHVYGIEVAAEAVEDAVAERARQRIENCTFLAGEVRHVLPELVREGVRADCGGRGPAAGRIPSQGAGAVAALGPERIVYVSCNPATLARDVGDLVQRGYRLEWAQPVDMFPQTPHIEAVARLRRVV